jgi:hypothetical protein
VRLDELELGFWFDLEQPGASEKALERAERALGRRLPPEFARALRIRNGGVSNYSGFRRGDYYVPLPAFFSVEDLVRAEEHRVEFGTPAGVVAIASGGHDWLGLDYRMGGEPAIVYQETEDSDLEGVADSFEGLLDGLVEE